MSIDPTTLDFVVRANLGRWRSRRVSRRDVRAYPLHDHDVLLQIDGDGVRVESAGAAVRPDDEERLQHVQAWFDRCRGDFDSLPIVVCLHDGAREETRIPLFGFSKNDQMPSALLIPDIYAMDGYTALVEARAADAVPLDAKEPKICFRGTDTGDLDPRKNRRLRFCAATEHLDFVDARITANVQQDAQRLRQVYPGSGRWFVSCRSTFDEQLKFKYQLDIEGNVHSWDRLVWMMGTKTVPLRLKGQWWGWYHLLLHADQHFVEVTLNNLEQTYRELENDPDRCRGICQRANRFATEVLSQETAVRYTRELLRLYQRICDSPSRISETTRGGTRKHAIHRTRDDGKKFHYCTMCGADNMYAFLKTTLPIVIPHFDVVHVIDTGSTDRTASLIHLSPKIRYRRLEHWNGDWAAAYPEAVRHVPHGDWFLFMDADELPSPPFLDDMHRLAREAERSHRKVVGLRSNLHIWDDDDLSQPEFTELPQIREDPNPPECFRKHVFIRMHDLEVSAHGSHCGFRSKETDEVMNADGRLFFNHYKTKRQIARSLFTQGFWFPRAFSGFQDETTVAIVERLKAKHNLTSIQQLFAFVNHPETLPHDFQELIASWDSPEQHEEKRLVYDFVIRNGCRCATGRLCRDECCRYETGGLPANGAMS